MNSRDLKNWLIRYSDFFKGNTFTAIVENDYYKINFNLPNDSFVEISGDLKGDWLKQIEKDLNKHFNNS